MAETIALPWIRQTGQAGGHALKEILAVQPPLSLAQTSFHALHAFRFVNAAHDEPIGNRWPVLLVRPRKSF